MLLKEIPNLPGYSVSENGNVFRKGKELKQSVDPEGYLRVSIGKKYPERVHRLVAVTFIDNPEGKPFVDHIDGDKKNNNVSNLRWVTGKENSKYACELGLIRHGISKKIVAIDAESRQAITFESQAKASRELGIPDSEINKALKNKRETCHGYYFGYME